MIDPVTKIIILDVLWERSADAWDLAIKHPKGSPENRKARARMYGLEAGWQKLNGADQLTVNDRIAKARELRMV